MALAHSPKIVTDGLVLCLDAANPKSYPGSGTTWTDLTKNNLSASMMSAPAFSNGYFTCDNNDDGFEITNFPQIFSNSVSLDCWYYFNDDSRAILFGSYNGSIGINFEKNTSYRLRLWWNSGANDIHSGNNAVTPNTWSHIVIVRNEANSTFDFYVNGVLMSQPTVTSADVPSSLTTFRVCRDSRTGTTTLNGRVSVVKFYSKALTAQEVNQNFNALRGRYGL